MIRYKKIQFFCLWLFNQWCKILDGMIYEDVGKLTYISCPNTSSISIYRKVFITQSWVLLSGGVFSFCYPAIYVCSVLCRPALTHDCTLHNGCNHPSLQQSSYEWALFSTGHTLSFRIFYEEDIKGQKFSNIGSWFLGLQLWPAVQQDWLQ